MIQNRQKWFNTNFNLAFKSVVKQLNSLPYNETNSSGFDLIEIRQTKIFSRYIERQDLIEEVLHPLGGVETVNSVRYIIFQFEVKFIAEDTFLIKIVNPPVSLKGFVGRLSEIFRDGFFISTIKIDVEDCFNYLIKSKFSGRYSVESVLVSNIPFGDKTVATFNLKSTDNAYKEFKKKYIDVNYKIEKVGLRLRVNNQWEYINISSSGLIICTSGLDDLVEEYIENFLIKDSILLKHF